MQRDRWHLNALVHEAVRNVGDWRAKLFPILVFAVLGGSCLAVFFSVEANSLHQQLTHLTMEGRLVVDISSTNPQTPVKIERESCEDLAHQPGVARAGIYSQIAYLEVPQLGASIPFAGVSTTLFPELDHVDALIGSELREPGPDFTLTLPNDVLGTTHVMAAQPRGVDTNSAVLVPLVPAQDTGPSCRVVMGPLSDPAEVVPRAVAQLRTTEAGDIIAISPFQNNIDPIQQFLGRSARNLPLLLGLLGGFAAAVINRVRFGELAAYRLSGTSGRSLALLLTLEQCLLAGVLATSTALAAVATGLVLGYPASVAAATLSGLGAAATWVITAALFTLDIPARRPTDLAKDR